jgi:hypothetical protein
MEDDMTFNFGTYMREQFGDDVVVLQSSDANWDYDGAVRDFRAGRSSRAACRETLFALGVPAGQIRRILAGESLPTAACG